MPKEYMRRFFASYGACAAFGLIFNLITPE
jgi:hypothetical protein